MNGVDTNVLIYARDPRDPRKQRIAASLIRSLRDGVLLWQVACEYVAASRKLSAYGFTALEAFEDIRALRAVWASSLPDWDTLDHAEGLQRRYSLSSWDALLVSSCVESGIERLYSEDFGGHGHIDSVEIVDPFA